MLKSYICDKIKRMAFAKTEEFSVKDNKIATYAKALSHPARVAIIKMLLNRKTCVCGDIVDELPLSQSTVSQHLKELKSAGLIQGEIDGARICYCINPEEWEKAKSYFLDLLSVDFQSTKKCC